MIRATTRALTDEERARYESLAIPRRRERSARPLIRVGLAAAVGGLILGLLAGLPWAVAGAVVGGLLAVGGRREDRDTDAVTPGAISREFLARDEVLAVRLSGVTRAIRFEAWEDEGDGWLLVSGEEGLLLSGPEHGRLGAELRTSGELVLHPDHHGPLSCAWDGEPVEAIEVIPRDRVRTTFPGGLERFRQIRCEDGDWLDALRRDLASRAR